MISPKSNWGHCIIVELLLSHCSTTDKHLTSSIACWCFQKWAWNDLKKKPTNNLSRTSSPWDFKPSFLLLYFYAKAYYNNQFPCKWIDNQGALLQWTGFSLLRCLTSHDILPHPLQQAKPLFLTRNFKEATGWKYFPSKLRWQLNHK